MCWDCNNNDKGDPYKNFRRGGVEVEDFADEFRYMKPSHKTQFDWSKKKRRASMRASTRPGCPENNFKAHPYVWTTELESEKTIFFRFFGFHKYQREVCCGCGKRRKTENTERYVKRKDRAWEKFESLPKGQPVSRYRRGLTRYSWFVWEDYNDEYMDFRKEEIAKVGAMNADVDGRFLGLY